MAQGVLADQLNRRRGKDKPPAIWLPHSRALERKAVRLVSLDSRNDCRGLCAESLTEAQQKLDCWRLLTTFELADNQLSVSPLGPLPEVVEFAPDLFLPLSRTVWAKGKVLAGLPGLGNSRSFRLGQFARMRHGVAAWFNCVGASGPARRSCVQGSTFTAPLRKPVVNGSKEFTTG